jgi:hypothetical protein
MLGVAAAFCNVPALALELDAPEGYAIDSCSGTDSKPQSKLWYLDGSWWCIIDSPAGNCIFELVDKQWRRLETPVLGGHDGRADALWDGKRLIVLMYYEKAPSQLFEFEYDHHHRSYRPTAAPVPLVIAPGSETMVIDQDSRRRLWVSYIADKKVYVAHSEADHSHWNLPGEVLQDSVSKDDISSVIAFGGHFVGVMWSDQKRDEFGFRVRADRDSLHAWHAEEVVDPGDGHADDHLHLTADRNGRVYAVTKDDRHKLNAHMRAPDGTWTNQEDILQGGDGTRPILLTAEDDHQLVMLYTRWHEGDEIISYRTSPLGALQFGAAMPFIAVPGVELNDITATKQSLPRGNLVAVADGDHIAWWNGWGAHSGPRVSWELTERVVWPLADAALGLDFDEGSGHEVVDDSPHALRGQLGGPWADDMCEPHWTRGVCGTGLEFDGVRDFVRVAAAPQLDLPGSLTLEAWVRRHSHDTKDVVLSKGIAGSRNYQVAHRWRPPRVPARGRCRQESRTARFASLRRYALASRSLCLRCRCEAESPLRRRPVGRRGAGQRQCGPEYRAAPHRYAPDRQGNARMVPRRHRSGARHRRGPVPRRLRPSDTLRDQRHASLVPDVDAALVRSRARSVLGCTPQRRWGKAGEAQLRSVTGFELARSISACRPLALPHPQRGRDRARRIGADDRLAAGHGERIAAASIRRRLQE